MEKWSISRYKTSHLRQNERMLKSKAAATIAAIFLGSSERNSLFNTDNAGWVAGQTYNNSIPEYEFVAIGCGYYITHEAPLATKIHMECVEGSFGIGKDHGNGTPGLDSYYGTISAGQTKDFTIWNGGIFNINGRSVGINRAKVWIYNEIWGGLN